MSSFLLQNMKYLLSIYGNSTIWHKVLRMILHHSRRRDKGSAKRFLFQLKDLKDINRESFDIPWYWPCSCLSNLDKGIFLMSYLRKRKWTPIVSPIFLFRYLLGLYSRFLNLTADLMCLHLDLINYRRFHLKIVIKQEYLHSLLITKR